MSAPKALPGNARAHMDTEQVVAAAEAAAEATHKLIGLVGFVGVVAYCRDDLDDTAAKLTEALHAVLSFHDGRDDDGDYLLHALDRYLP